MTRPTVDLSRFDNSDFPKLGAEPSNAHSGTS
jgi:hypothetical protein